jgi:hypothetical protein
MREKTSAIVGSAIATILTAYISTLALSNQAFAQHWYNDISSPHGQPGTSADHNLVGKILGTHPGLGCRPWGTCVNQAHKPQLGELDGNGNPTGDEDGINHPLK